MGKILAQFIGFTLSFVCIATLAFADTDQEFYKPNERFPLLTYEEFRRLTEEDQASYLKILRDFYTSLEQSPQSSSSLQPDLFNLLFSLSPVAQAEGDISNRPQIRCLYAGFLITGRECRPQGHFTTEDRTRTYACNFKSILSSEKGAQVLRPKPTREEENVLCHPLLFGTTADEQPFCVAKGIDATKNCLRKASLHPESTKRAVALQKTNPKSSKELIQTLNLLCQGDPATMKMMLTKRVRSQSLVIAHVRKTCRDFGREFLSFHQQNQSTNPAEQPGRR